MISSICSRSRLFLRSVLKVSSAFSFICLPSQNRHDRWLVRYALDYYLHEPYSADYAIVAHAGHWVNSYAMHYYLVAGRLRLFLQVPWGGANGDRKEDTEYTRLAQTGAGSASKKIESVASWKQSMLRRRRSTCPVRPSNRHRHRLRLLWPWQVPQGRTSETRSEKEPIDVLRGSCAVVKMS
jgi:hypothetical protein